MGIIRGRRIKTAREEALHDQIRDALNWSPDHFRLCKDGKSRNARGELGIATKISFSELLNLRKNKEVESETENNETKAQNFDHSKLPVKKKVTLK